MRVLSKAGCRAPHKRSNSPAEAAQESHCLLFGLRSLIELADGIPVTGRLGKRLSHGILRLEYAYIYRERVIGGIGGGWGDTGHWEVVVRGVT